MFFIKPGLKNLLTKPIYTLLLCFIMTNIYAQQKTGSIQGTVITSDDKSGESVTVVISQLKKSDITDENGVFHFKNIPEGNYDLQINMKGYEPIIKNVTVSADQTAEVSIQLNSSLRELQEVVVVSGAKKFAEKKSEYVARLPISNLENPQVYTVVPKELLQEQIAIDFRNALTTAPGLSNITQSVGSGGVGVTFRIRGFSGNAVSIRNGMNTNWVTMSDPANLETIEVIKGPSGTLFGSTLATYGGLTNRVTKKPFETFKGEVSYSTGSWALSRTTIDVNTPVNEEKTMLFRINAALDNQKTWQDYGRSKSLFVAPSFSYKISERLTFDLDMELYSGSRNSTYIGLGNFNPANSQFKSFDDFNFNFKKSYSTDELQSEAKTTNIFARFSYQLSENWISQTNLSNAYTDNNANYLFLLINNPAAGETIPLLQRRLMSINSIFKTTQIQQNFIGNFKIGSLRNRLLLGIDYTYLGTNDNRWMINSFDAAIGEPLTPINGDAPFINYDKYRQLISEIPVEDTWVNNRDFRTLSFYGSDVINITERLIAMASLRFDHYENKTVNYNQNTLSPKMGLIYQIVKNKISLFGNYMNGFTNVAPNTTAASPTTNVEFDPEKANQLEAGIKFELLEGKLNGTLSYYDIEVKDKVRQDPVNTLFSIQNGTQKSKGFEADLIANPVRGLHLIFGYGYNDNKFTKANANVEGKRPGSTPANVANFWASYKLLDGTVKGLGFGFGGNIQSDSYANDTNTFTVDGYTVLDATVFYEKPKFRIGLKLNNIANKEYWTTDYWNTMMPTRQLVANFTFKF